MLFLLNNREAARFATDLSLLSNSDSQSITIIIRGRSEVSYVHIATGMLSEDIVAKVAWNYSLLPIDISAAKRTLAGLSRQK